MLSVFQTVIAGVTVFVVGHLLAKFILEPIQEFWKVTGRISDALVFYANVYSNPGVGPEELINDAHKYLRQHASALIAAKNAIPIYDVWARLRVVPERTKLVSAHSNLIGLSNSVFRSAYDNVEHNSKRVTHIASALGLDIGQE